MVTKEARKTNVDIEINNPNVKSYPAVQIIENIPKVLASSSSEVEFQTKPLEIINPDPLVSWVVINLEKGKNPGSVSDFWDIPTRPSSNEHYASYNDELIRKPILAGCPEGGIVYDPFMGTGSTAEVCLRSKRLFIGSEMSEKYVEIANKRLEPFLMQQTLF